MASVALLLTAAIAGFGTLSLLAPLARASTELPPRSVYGEDGTVAAVEPPEPATLAEMWYPSMIQGRHAWSYKPYRDQRAALKHDPVFFDGNFPLRSADVRPSLYADQQLNVKAARELTSRRSKMIANTLPIQLQPQFGLNKRTTPAGYSDLLTA